MLMFILVQIIYYYNTHLNHPLHTNTIHYSVISNVTSSLLWRFQVICHTVKAYNAQLLSEDIKRVNNEEKVMNQDVFGPMYNNKISVVIIVQVHDRINYLRHLIKSLSIAKGINETLIIFSHDIWDDEMNTLVRSIKFAKVLQIFYPYSIQTHGNIFPGDSPSDCPSGVSKEQAKKLNCLNAEWPDHFGHYRTAKVAQIKHHWWWKAHRVFDELQTIRNYDGLVLFLEEDHYLTEDFLEVLSQMNNQRNKMEPLNDIICLGTHATKLSRDKDNYKKVEVTYWHYGHHNMGMAFDRKVWEKIKMCRQAFCNFDDYNWDFSLAHLSFSCMKESLRVMFLKGPRIFHMGECGFHNKKNIECNTEEVVRKIISKLEQLHHLLYPRSLIFEKFRTTKQRKLLGNGGWGDKRDREMCIRMDILHSTTIEQVLRPLVSENKMI